MKCKEGYVPDSPLCAVCDDGYSEQLRSCVQCKTPLIWHLILVALVFVVVTAVCVCIYRKHSHYLNGLLSHAKIFVSFFAIVGTLKAQFGVRWPPVFLSILAIFSSLSLDLGVLSALFCLVRVSYFQSLIFSTLGLVVALSVLYAVQRIKAHDRGRRSLCTKVAVYLLLFAYPSVSVKITKTCGRIEHKN